MWPVLKGKIMLALVSTLVLVTACMGYVIGCGVDWLFQKHRRDKR